jgi:hypothetical protein
MKSPWALQAMFCAATLVVATSGCRENLGTIPVKGQVTFAGKPPGTPGYLFFVPVLEGSANDGHRRPGSALFLGDGRFCASTYRHHDGLLPGRYQVRVDCAAGGDGHDHAAARSLVPEGFMPPALVVEPNAHGAVRYDLDVR